LIDGANMTQSELYDHLNKQWISTCKILLGREIGDINEYAKWLYEGNGPRMVEKSVTGKEVVFVSNNYPAYSK